MTAGPAIGAISGFGDGSSYTLTGYTQDDAGNITDNAAPTISSGALTITTNSAAEARAAYFNTPQTIGTFTAKFTYQNTAKDDPADGIAFVLQNDPRGLTAIGGGGAGLGYGLLNNNQPPTGPAITPVVNSAAIQLYLRNSATGASNYNTGGVSDFGAASSTTPVNLNSGDPIAVTLVYNGTTLTETLVDTATADTYTTSYTADIAAAIGQGTAYVGFTGGTGGAYETQTISNFTFTAVPEPASLTLLCLTALPLLRRRRAMA